MNYHMNTRRAIREDRIRGLWRLEITALHHMHAAVDHFVDRLKATANKKASISILMLQDWRTEIASIRIAVEASGPTKGIGDRWDLLQSSAHAVVVAVGDAAKPLAGMAASIDRMHHRRVGFRGGMRQAEAAFQGALEVMDRVIDDARMLRNDGLAV